MSSKKKNFKDDSEDEDMKFIDEDSGSIKDNSD